MNVLDNEQFGVGLPKGDGQQDYEWNKDRADTCNYPTHSMATLN